MTQKIRKRMSLIQSLSTPSKITVRLIDYPFSFARSFFKIHLLTCAYIVWVISPLCPPSSTLPPLTSRQKLFCPYL
jgi:hypothetical protein